MNKTSSARRALIVPNRMIMDNGSAYTTRLTKALVARLITGGSTNASPRPADPGSEAHV